MAEVQFSLAPGHVNDEIINYSSSEGIKLFNQATNPIEPKYDLNTGHLYTFLHEVRSQAMMCNWSSIYNISVPSATTVAGEVAPKYDILTQYGQVTLAQVRSDAETYQCVEQRKAQNAYQLYMYKSLDAEAKVRVAVKEAN